MSALLGAHHMSALPTTASIRGIILVTAPIPISGGMLPLPHKPGLGVALRKEVLSWPDARVEVKE